MSNSSMSYVVHAETPDPRRWFALVVIAIAQLMVVLDASIVNIALPHAALPKALGGLAIAHKNYQWAVTAYTLTFGGFLLLGGRIGDYLGRKKAFLIGLLGFAGASLLGGFAQNQQMLFGARALQGVFGALLAPAALSLISVTFTDSKERAKGLRCVRGPVGRGGAIGLIAGGLLTQYLSWRWCLFVNTPMAIIAFALAVPNVNESKVDGHPHYDVPGAMTRRRDGERRLRRLPGVDERLGVDQLVAVHVLGGWPARRLLRDRVAHQVATAAAATHHRPRSGGGVPLPDLVGLGLFGMFLFMTFYFQNIQHTRP